MHLGNVFTALLSRLAAHSTGGKWILRIEDLDTQRCRSEYARLIEDDLQWLGLTWDEGGLDAKSGCGSYCQSERGELYHSALQRLVATGMTYPCRCTRAERNVASAPHSSDGRVLYNGKCRPTVMPNYEHYDLTGASIRLAMPDREIWYDDAVMGRQRYNLLREVGDIILRRADGAWTYQLAVVVDDHAMGVGQVVRGADLMLSAAQQIYIYRLLGWEPPVYGHVPLVCNAAGVRLSKRDLSLSMESLRRHYTPHGLLGRLAHMAGLLEDEEPVSVEELEREFDIARVRAQSEIRVS